MASLIGAKMRLAKIEAHQNMDMSQIFYQMLAKILASIPCQIIGFALILVGHILVPNQ
jgi:1-acyl-sn-glycerol-3-phosphate acyltransferase